MVIILKGECSDIYENILASIQGIKTKFILRDKTIEGKELNFEYEVLVEFELIEDSSGNYVRESYVSFDNFDFVEKFQYIIKIKNSNEYEYILQYFEPTTNVLLREEEEDCIISLLEKKEQNKLIEYLLTHKDYNKSSYNNYIKCLYDELVIYINDILNVKLKIGEKKIGKYDNILEYIIYDAIKIENGKFKHDRKKYRIYELIHLSSEEKEKLKYAEKIINEFLEAFNLYIEVLNKKNS